MSKKKKICLWGGIALICVLLTVYLAFSLFFTERYYWGTKIGDIDCGGKTPAQAEQLIADRAGEYALTVSGREGTEAMLTAKELGIAFLPERELQELSDMQNGFWWVSFLWNQESRNLPVTVSYQEEALEKRLSEVLLFREDIMRPPVDAYVGEYNPSEGRYAIVPEEAGTLVDTRKAKAAIIRAVEAMQTELSLEEADCYIAPKICSDNRELTEFCQRLNRYVSSRIVYDWHGIEEIVDGSLIHGWLDIDRDSQRAAINPQAVRDYVDKLSRKNDSYGKLRKFQTSSGKEIYIKPGNYGWRVDRKKEAERLIGLIRRGGQTNREPEYFYTAAARGPDDIGGSYVEINLTAQHLYLYVNGSLVTESDLVSGNVSRGFTTPEGVYGLTYKTRDATLKGQGYATPVSYWMPFNGNIGMHDAGWRKQFGGDIYLRNGSHGCINLPLEEAEKIYEHVSQGFPVICYYEEADEEGE